MGIKLKFSTKITPGSVTTQELDRRVKVAPNAVKVGLPDVQHPDSTLTFAALGFIHEFGAPSRNIPERPFLQPGIEEGKPALRALMEKLAKQIVDGQIDKQTAMMQLGMLGVRLVQRKIIRGPFTPLKPSTIARKGSDKPLIDTGEMLRSVDYMIASGK